MNIAIIGAGLSGTNLYNLLKKNNDVTIFEKARGAGGRCSTRYIKDKFIDHGTPFFKTSSDEFKDFCEQKVKEEVLYKSDEYYFPTNGMNKLCSSLIDNNDLIRGAKIVSCKFKNNKWRLKDENGISYGSFDILLLTVPATQILELDMDMSEEFRDNLSQVSYNPIASLMVYSYTFENLMNPKLTNSKLFKKIVDNSNKYNYENFSSYVIHLDEELTKKQNFQNRDEVNSFMLKKIYEISSINLEEDFYVMPHLWKYAFVDTNLSSEYLFDKELSLGICGDYFKTKDLEGSYLSSKRLYEQQLS